MNILELFNAILVDKKIQSFVKDLKKHHPETAEHCLRVGLLSMKMGEKNNFSKKDIEILGYSGILHDLGKLDITKKILRKKSKLNDKERTKIERHAKKGFYRLKNFPKIKEIVLHHHEYQQQSYPCNSKESEYVCKISRIVSVADMFDALSNKRAYRKALKKSEVRKILKKEFTGDKIYIEQITNLN